MLAKQSVQPSRSSQPRLAQQERSETSATEEVAESSLETEAITTALLESFEAADLPFEEQAELLASLLQDGASGDAAGIDQEESLNAASEALTPEEVEAELAASLTAAGVSPAEMQALLASLLPDSDATAPAEPTVEESLNAASEALTPEEVEAELAAASLTAAGVSPAEMQALLASLLPDSDATAPAEPTVEESLNAASEALTPEEVEAELVASLTAAGVSPADIALLVEHLLPHSDSPQ